MTKKSIIATTMMAAAMTLGIGDIAPIGINEGRHRYSRRRDNLPEDVQEEKIRKAKEKRERKAQKRLEK